jgi:CheY-like chemotaxis protein
VRNGQEAVDAVRRKRYDVILMDCQMPEKDGFEATAEIRALEGSDRHTRIVAVTAHAIDGDREKCLAAGMDDYLSKPVKVEALRKILAARIPEVPEDLACPEELKYADDENVIDREVLASYAQLQQPGETDLVVKLIDLFMDRNSSSITCLKRAAAAGDMAGVARHAHGIKGSSGNVGAGLMAELSARLETADGPAQAAELAADLEIAFEEASDILISIRGQRPQEANKL